MIDIAILRMLHIVFGMLWVGIAIANVVVFHPLARRFFPESNGGNRLLMRLYSESAMPKLFPIAAIITTVAGLYITGRLFVVRGGPWLPTSLGMNVLYFGMIVGLLAFGHGLALGALTAKYARASREVLAADGPTPDQASTLENLEGRLDRSGRISVVLTLVALIAMSSARYIGQ